MKINKYLLPNIALLSLLTGCSQSAPETEISESKATQTASTYARFVPERLDDFAWENDLVAFRAYGPAARAGAENSGIDCWLKRVDYPIIDLWYKRAIEQKISYHKDNGEGIDNYHVGASAGCGSEALWLDGQYQPLETYTDWKITEQTTQKTTFTLFYEHLINGDKYTKQKTISIELGKRMFSVATTFWKNDALLIDHPIAVAVATHDGKGKAQFSQQSGYLSVWENIGGYDLGTGIKLDPSRIQSQQLINDENIKDDGHAMYIINTDKKGSISYNAGYGWSKAGAITTEQQWLDYLANY